ncbi:MAG: carboxypeptidase regulatory-like domain-containing protein [Bacteroidales bacterium]|nr:carboxypeptidase regulatory-like domain-containing protein [Bacteroidales bacterium]
MAVYASDGAGNLPGTLLDSIWVVATDTGWIHFEGLEAVIPSGDFYLGMIQGSDAPDCVPLGVDQTLPRAFKSYSRQVTAGEGWVVSPYQDLMIRAVITSPQGDTPIGKSPARFIIPQRVKGMISQNPPNAIPGYEAGAPLMQPGTLGSNESVAFYKIFRVANFDPLAGPQTGTLTLISSNVSVNQYVDGPGSWINLPEGWYAYAIQSVYPSGNSSELSFSEPVPHKLFAEVNIDVKLLCEMASVEGAEVILTGADYPFSVYHGATDATGNAVFHNLIEGQYTLQVSYPGYSTWVTNQQISNSSTIEVVLEDRKYAPRNLTADDMTLVAQWDPPLSVLLDENFEGTVFPPPGWQSTFQGSAGWFVTNDGAFGYFQVPDHTYYAMTNDGDAGNNNNGCCDLLITPVINLTDAENYQLEFESYHLGDYGYTSTVEISFDAGQTWSVIYTPFPPMYGSMRSLNFRNIRGSMGRIQSGLLFTGMIITSGPPAGVWMM